MADFRMFNIVWQSFDKTESCSHAVDTWFWEGEEFREEAPCTPLMVPFDLALCFYVFFFLVQMIVKVRKVEAEKILNSRGV